MKPVLLIVIDALSARHVRRAMDAGRLPNLQSLAELGELREQCTSVFPSVTPAATASIITGRYPSEHGIPGAFFYDTEKDHVDYLGDDIWAILHKGCREFFDDFLVRLHQDVLSTPTLFQRVEQAGMRAASLNYLIIGGQHQHSVDVPWLLRLIPGVAWRKEVIGPDLLCLGDLVAGTPNQRNSDLSAPGGVFHRYGFQDDSTVAFLLELAKKDALEDLTVAYFPDNDYDSHSDGPTSAIATLENVDQHLGELFRVCGGVESLLAARAVLITGDHSQSDLVAEERARSIELEDVLDDFSLVPAGQRWTDNDQLMVCPNLRACQIYLGRGHWAEFDQLVSCLLGDPRVDQVIWRTVDDDGESRFHVRSQQHGEVTFWRGGSNTERGSDAFGNRWDWSGSLAPLDTEVSSSGRLQFGDYPNALERIAHSFAKPTGGDLWVTAHTGHEFRLPETSVQNCGSHGTLHELDSTSPLIMAGAPDDISLPADVRIVDVADLCLKTLGIR